MKLETEAAFRNCQKPFQLDQPNGSKKPAASKTVCEADGTSTSKIVINERVSYSLVSKAGLLPPNNFNQIVFPSMTSND